MRTIALRAYAGHFRYVVSENPITFVAFTLFLLIVGMALIGPYVVPYDPLASDTVNKLKPPSWEH